MKTTHDFSKASEAKFAWWCYAIWWMDALALLGIMIIVSVYRAMQDRRTVPLDEGEGGEIDHGFAGHPSAI